MIAAGSEILGQSEALCWADASLIWAQPSNKMHAPIILHTSDLWTLSKVSISRTG